MKPVSKAELEQQIRKAFPQATPIIQDERGRLNGVIVWQGFQDMPARERNQQVTELVRNPFKIGAINVGLLVPLAPGEHL